MCQGGDQLLLVRLFLEALQPGQPRFVPCLVALRVQERLAVWLRVAPSADEDALHEIGVGGSEPYSCASSHREAEHRWPLQPEYTDRASRVLRQQFWREAAGDPIGTPMPPRVQQNEIVVLLQDFRHAQPAEGALLQSVQKDKLRLLTPRAIVVLAYPIGLQIALGPVRRYEV